MLKIKLSRVGKKKQPTYRIVLMEHTKDPWGDNLELLGHYNPRIEPNLVNLKEDRIKYWLSKGAQPSDTIHNLLVDAKIIDDKKRNVSSLGKKAKEKLAEDKKKKEEKKNAKQAPAEEEKDITEESTTENKPAKEALSNEAKTKEKPTQSAQEKNEDSKKEKVADSSEGQEKSEETDEKHEPEDDKREK